MGVFCLNRLNGMHLILHELFIFISETVNYSPTMKAQRTLN